MKRKNQPPMLAVLAALVLCFMAAPPIHAQSQLTTPVSSVALSMNVAETVSLTTSPSTISFTSNGDGTATASGPLSVTVNWSLAQTRFAVTYYAWLSSASAALTNGVTNIPSSDVFANINNSGAFACDVTQSTGAPDGHSPANPGVAGAQCSSDGTNNGYFQIDVGGTSGNPFIGTETGTWVLSLAGLPALSPGAYSGTLNFEAIAE